MDGRLNMQTVIWAPSAPWACGSITNICIAHAQLQHDWTRLTANQGMHIDRACPSCVCCRWLNCTDIDKLCCLYLDHGRLGFVAIAGMTCFDVQAPALTVLLPLDSMGACGHCSRRLQIHPQGCSRHQLLHSIHSFYQVWYQAVLLLVPCSARL